MATKGLCDICSPKQWKTISSDMLTETGYPVFGANGVIGFFSTYNHEKETLLITCRGATCGNLNICQPYSYVTGNSMALDELSDEIDLYYLYYFLMNRGLHDVITGSAQPQIVRKSLEKVSVSYPGIEDQLKVVSVLNKVSSLIALRKQQLEKLDELVKARFVEMFGDPVENPMGWETDTIKNVCSSILGGGTPSKKIPEYFDGTIPWVTPKDMKSIKITDSQDHITDDAIANSSTNLIPEDSVLMVIRSGILKHTLPVAVNAIPVTINQDMKAFIPDKRIATVFLLYYFILSEKSILSRIRGVTADNIDFDEFKSRSIILPPVKLQEEFGLFVFEVEKARDSIQRSLIRLETLKNALMQEYFG